jgi:DNA-binding NtrC family response regulator
MAKNDVVQIEDDLTCISNVCTAVETADLRYKVLTSLAKLTDYLKKGDAGVWVVDSYFPAKDGGESEYNALKAIEAIRAARRDAKIILYSTTPPPSAGCNLEGVEVMGKLDYPAEKLMPVIKNKLKGV